MDFEFSEDTLMLRDMLRKFVQKEARPLEMDYFNTGSLKPEQRTKLRRSIDQLGLWGITAPEEFGGGGLDTVTACVIEEELGGTFLPLEVGNIFPLLYACQGDQVGNFLEPVMEGSRKPVIAAREPGPEGVRPENWKTMAAPDGDGFVLNGQKVLTNRPETKDFLVLFATVPPQEKATDQTAFLLELDTPGMTLDGDGKPAKGLITLTLKDCKVGRESLLGEVGGGLKIAANEAPRSWIRTGARYVGIVERLIEMAAEHARDWVSLGAPLAVRPAIQRMLAEMRVEVESVRWMVYHAAWLADQEGGEKIRLPAAQVRLASGEMLKRAVDKATMIYTGPGPSNQTDPLRLVQSVVPMEALELALENARMLVANQMLNLR